MREYDKTHFGKYFGVIVMSNLCSVYISTWDDLVVKYSQLVLWLLLASPGLRTECRVSSTSMVVVNLTWKIPDPTKTTKGDQRRPWFESGPLTTVTAKLHHQRSIRYGIKSGRALFSRSINPHME